MGTPAPALDPLESRLKALEETLEDIKKRPDVTHDQRCLCTEHDRPPPSGRRLIVALDGTANKFGARSSHVVEFYSRVIKREDQPSYYLSGIGTYARKDISRWRVLERMRVALPHFWASITAGGFESNILASYQWLSENYQPGDQIYLLGYSRGAYQVRVLAAMIGKVGLICTGNREQIPFALEIYRDPQSSAKVTVFSDGSTKDPNRKNPAEVTVKIVANGKGFTRSTLRMFMRLKTGSKKHGTNQSSNHKNSDRPVPVEIIATLLEPDDCTTTTAAEEFKKAFRHDVPIHFVGVWDTVSSVGLFRNKSYPNARSANNVCFFRHALALDEKRVKFLPEYVAAPESAFKVGEFGSPRCKEVWFRGCHSDVRWMAYEAMLAGLQM
ncbi:hypothetical protein FB45DRAFT_836360, partial [Roridomyces roridus]